MALPKRRRRINYSELLQGENESDTSSCPSDKNDDTWVQDTYGSDSERENYGENHESDSDVTPVQTPSNSEDVIPEVNVHEGPPVGEGDIVNGVVPEVNVQQGPPAGEGDIVNVEQTVNVPQITRSRKRKRDPSKWKARTRQRKRESGSDYINIKGKYFAARTVVQPLPNHKCKFGCTTKFNEEERKYINQHFWTLNDEKKLHFYGKFVDIVEKARCRTPAGENSRRKNSYVYYLEVDSERMRVCKTFFLQTLNISERRLYYFYEHNMKRGTGIPISPRKGKNRKKFISEERKEKVREHIRSFPRVESHYCRANTKKEYLETALNIQKMYELYTEKVENPVKLHMYRHIFNYEFNIEFHKPKKDLCDMCEEKRLNPNISNEDKAKYDNHDKGRKETKDERQTDRAKFKTRSNIKECVLCFDLENVISLPRANTSNFFYKRKLNCYNLTAHCSLDNKTYCSVWHESIAGRAGNHIASALYAILEKVVTVHTELEKIVLWSDSCTPQNRNSVMTLALQTFIRSHPQIKEITQKFSEPGHSSVQEIDSAHSIIERALGHSQIYSPVTLMRVLNDHVKRKKNLVIVRLNPSNFFEFQTAGKYFRYSDIPFTKVKLLHLTSKDILHVGYKTAFSGIMITKRLRTVTPGRRNNLLQENAANIVWPNIKVISKPEPLSKGKYLDLKSMLKWMPLDDRRFYGTLLNIDHNSNPILYNDELNLKYAQNAA